MNLSVLSGRLVYEIEVKETNDGKKFVSTRIAVPRNDKNKTTDFFNFKAWGNTAEFISKYFKKGDPITLIGELRTYSYEKNGAKVEQTYVEVSKVEFVPRASEGKEAKSREVSSSELPFEV